MLAASSAVLDDWEPAPLWLLEEQFASRCPHCDETADELAEPVAPVAAEPVGWAIPGVTGLDRPDPAVLPEPSAEVAELLRAFDRVVAASGGRSDAQVLVDARVLVDAEALLGLEQRLRVHSVSRIAEVGRRGLHALVGFRSLRSWLRARRPDGDAGDANLGQALEGFPVLQAAVTAGEVPLGSARLLVKALSRCWWQLDRPDGLIDGQPGSPVLQAVVSNAVSLICRYLNGLEQGDPRLAVLIDRAGRILDQSGSQRSQVEATFTLLAEQVPARALGGCVEELVLALLPSELEDKADRGHQRRSLELTRNADGSGWQVHGQLDLECGERLFLALRAEASRDPDNITDTLAWQTQAEQNQAEGSRAGQSSDLLDQALLPRSRPHRLHDALNRLLARHLDHGLGGTVNKLPVQIAVTITEPALSGRPGALPARADSGALIPRSLVKRWWCDSQVTAFVLSLGGKALRAVHSQRTLTALERRALQIETGGRCAGQGCCSDPPDPLSTLVPHHTVMFSKTGRTSLDASVALCERAHHDLHEGNKTLLLRDGRYLNEHGFTTPPPWPETEPPF